MYFSPFLALRAYRFNTLFTPQFPHDLPHNFGVVRKKSQKLSGFSLKFAKNRLKWLTALFQIRTFQLFKRNFFVFAVDIIDNLDMVVIQINSVDKSIY